MPRRPVSPMQPLQYLHVAVSTPPHPAFVSPLWKGPPHSPTALACSICGSVMLDAYVPSNPRYDTARVSASSLYTLEMLPPKDICRRCTSFQVVPQPLRCLGSPTQAPPPVQGYLRRGGRGHRRRRIRRVHVLTSYDPNGRPRECVTVCAHALLDVRGKTGYGGRGVKKVGWGWSRGRKRGGG